MPTSYRRDEEPTNQRLLAAFVVSLLAHVSLFGVVQIGNQLKWWDSQPFSMFRKVRFTPEEIAKLQEEQRRRQEEQPTIFVQVTQPSEDTPTQTALYSSLSSRAANPEPAPGDQPKIDGRQTQTLRTEDAPRIASGRPTPPPQKELPGTADASPETPSRASPQPEQVAAFEMPKLVEKIPEPARQKGLGEMALPSVIPIPQVTPEPPVERPPERTAEITPPPKPQPTPEPVTVQAQPAETGQETPAPRARPRTITEAKARQSLLSGEKMKQEGGVSRKGPVSLDVKGVPFGAYDEALIMAVQNRWFALLEERKFAGGARGKVVVKFNLHNDGSVRIVEPHESTLDDALLTALCVRAIRDPSPYEKWPSDMLRMLGTNMREMRFTFFYN
jgi:outer membrane biosynthesis protein TonB